MNFAVSASRGAHVVLLNDDVEVITPEWIEAMLEFSQQDEIGATAPSCSILTGGCSTSAS
jgi:GT2 family glycosyltransferase